MSFKNYINQQQNIHLSASQAHAVSKIAEFLNSPVYQTFIFKGAAGSGKTLVLTTRNANIIREKKAFPN